MRITAIEPFVCDGGLREFGFLKVTTDEGIVGWAETYDWHSVGIARDRAGRDGPAAHRRGPAPDRALQRAHLVPRRPGIPERIKILAAHRPRALGHQGEVARRAGVRAASAASSTTGSRSTGALRDVPGGLAGGARVPEPSTPTASGRRAPVTSSPQGFKVLKTNLVQEARARGKRAPADVPRRRDRQADARRGRELDRHDPRRRRAGHRDRGGRPVRLPDGRHRAARAGAGAVRPVLAGGGEPRRRTRCWRRASRPRPGCATASASSGASSSGRSSRSTSPTS